MATSFKQIAKESKASQGKLELEWLLKKVAAINPKVILEIGVHQGYSLDVWRKAFNPEVLLGVDNDLHAYNSKEKVLDADSHSDTTFVEVEKIVGGDRVDFLFLDGDHTYEGVKKDFYMYKALVRKGGIIAFHDAGLKDHPDVEVYKFWEEIDTPKRDFYKKDATGVGLYYV